MNLAVIAELPLVVIDVQRGGPSTGLPTKSEQTDLLQVLFGRNGESPMPVIAAATPTDCFDAAYQAAKIALEYMTPVVLLTDAFIANGSAAWRFCKSHVNFCLLFAVVTHTIHCFTQNIFNYNSVA